MLAILIPYTPDRIPLFDRLMYQLKTQAKGLSEDELVFLPSLGKLHVDGGLSTGARRNQLLQYARDLKASHVAFFDSDDLPGPNYIRIGLNTVQGDYDCAELWGQYYENNKMMNPFHHSIKYDRWYQDAKFYYRNPNHLNFIKLKLLDNIRFQDKTIGEDGHFSIDLQKAGVLKRQYAVNEIIYHYFAGKNKRHDLEPVWVKQRGTAL